MNVLGIYHSKDLDGLACGAIIKHKYPDVDLIGYHYGDPLNEITTALKKTDYDLVIMADVSLPMDDMIEVGLGCQKFVWVDHHVTAKRDYDMQSSFSTAMSIDEYIYDPTISACEGLWRYLFPDAHLPIPIFLLGKYDTWREDDEALYLQRTFTFEEALCFQMYMKLPGNYSIDGVLRMIVGSTADFIRGVSIGRSILEYQDAQDAKIAKSSSYVREFNGYRALVVIGGTGSSRAFESVWDPDLHDLCVSCYYNGIVWTYSLRTMKDGVDLSVLAKKYGGGGHVKASGFKHHEFLFK